MQDEKRKSHSKLLPLIAHKMGKIINKDIFIPPELTKLKWKES